MDWRGILLVTISLVLATQDGRGGDDIQTARKRMVKEIELDVMTTSLYIGRPQLTEEVMAVMAKVPRHEFVPNENQGAAYLNCPLPLELPPRSSIKMTATIAVALKRLDRSIEPSQHVAIIRTWNTVTIAVSPSPLSPQHLEAVRAFCRSRAFDLDWLPDITTAEVNRINVLDRPYLYEAAKEIWQGDQRLQSGLFDLTPATDDRPWFSHFFRWTSFKALWAQRASGTASMLEWEYLLLWMSLIVALSVGLLAIAWPLRPLYRAHRRNEQGAGGQLVRALYFAALVLAFFFHAIAFMQQCILFLSHPMVAMAVIVPSFLFFAGCGSGSAQYFARRATSSRWAWVRDRPVTVATAAIVIISLVYLEFCCPLSFVSVLAGPPPCAFWPASS